MEREDVCGVEDLGAVVQEQEERSGLRGEEGALDLLVQLEECEAEIMRTLESTEEDEAWELGEGEGEGTARTDITSGTTPIYSLNGGDGTIPYRDNRRVHIEVRQEEGEVQPAADQPSLPLGATDRLEQITPSPQTAREWPKR